MFEQILTNVLLQRGAEIENQLHAIESESNRALACYEQIVASIDELNRSLLHQVFTGTV